MGRVYEGGLRDSDRMELRTAELAAAAGGRLEGPDVVVDGATQDSRAVAQGQLFVPIVAERDGHEFIAAALANGAAAYLTHGPIHGGTAIVVPDTAAALQAAGRLARSHLPERVVGVTGSVGKTSVKDLLAAVLARRWTTAASLRSFNNELGVPLTLLNAPGGTEAVVVEMGARGVGHIAELCAIAAPTVGVVTRVAAVHTEVFGTIDEVARAKAELVEALPASGTAVLNAADERVAGDGEPHVGTRRDLRRRRRRRGRGHHAWTTSSALGSGCGHAVGERADRAGGARSAPGGERAGRRGRGAGRRRRPRRRRRGARPRRRCRPGGWSSARRRAAHASSTTPTTPTPRRWSAALESLAALPARRRVAVLGRDGGART